MTILIFLEGIVLVTGIAAVMLQAKEKILAWPLAIISVSIASYLFFQNRLYSDFGLHLIYIFLNIFGWYKWTSKNVEQAVSPTLLMSSKEIIIAVMVVLLGSYALGYLMFANTDADLPYFDAFTTSGSLVAQYLLAKKYLQNWLFWIVVDLVAIPIYLYKGMYLMALLFFAYLLICIWGYIAWRGNMKS